MFKQELHIEKIQKSSVIIYLNNILLYNVLADYNIVSYISSKLNFMQINILYNLIFYTKYYKTFIFQKYAYVSVKSPNIILYTISLIS